MDVRVRRLCADEGSRSELRKNVAVLGFRHDGRTQVTEYLRRFQTAIGHVWATSRADYMFATSMSERAMRDEDARKRQQRCVRQRAELAGL